MISISRAVRAPTFVIAIASAIVCASSARAVPTTLTYAGVLEDGGAPFNGTVNATFKLFPQASGGAELYNEDVNGLIVLGGDLVVELGNNGLDDSVLLDEPELWLEVTVDGEALEPRTRLNSVPYALRAELALQAEETLSFGGLLATDYVTQTRLASLAGAGLSFSGGVMSIANGGVTSTMLATNAVTTASVTDGSISLAKLAANSVDANKIVNASI